MERNVGGNPNSLDEQIGYLPTLNELGITRFQSHRWQPITGEKEHQFWATFWRQTKKDRMSPKGL